MLMPKRVKRRRVFRGRMKGNALRGNATGAQRLRARAEENLARGGLPEVADGLRERLRGLCDEAGAYLTG